MNYAEHHITLDINSTASNVSVSAKKGDTARRLRIHLAVDGYPYRISEDCYAVFTAQKPDGNVVYNNCTIEDNTIIYDLTEQTVAAEGVVECEIKLYGGHGKLITSARFSLAVNDTVYNEGDEVESTDEFNALAVLITETKTLVDDVEEKLANGEFVGEQGPPGPSGANPYKLHLTGAVEASYDGSEEVTVEIPEGGGDFGEYGLGVTANVKSIPSTYALDSIRQTGWYTVELSYGAVDFGDGNTASKFLLRVESGDCEQYTNVTRQTAMFSSYPGGQEYCRFCKNGYDWSAWEKVIHRPQKLTFTGAVNATYDGSEAVEVKVPSGGKYTKTKLWENADPWSDFPAQSFSTSGLSTCDAIEIVYSIDGSYGYDIASSGMIPLQSDDWGRGYCNYVLSAVTSHDGTPYRPIWRKVHFQGGNGATITFEDACCIYTTYNQEVPNNTKMVPLRIYGIEGVEQ